MTDVAEEFGRRVKIPVAKALAVAEDFIVLLDYDGASQAHLDSNLFRLRADGTIQWAACLPVSGDLVTNIDWRDGRLIAWTWDCRMMTIAPSNGTVVESVFTK